MLCRAVTELPEGADWQYEIKLDGYRALGIKSAGRTRLLSRNGNDFSVRFASVASALSRLPDESVVDGEIVALDESGRPSFHLLQNYHRSGSALQFYLFDLLHLAGRNVCHCPLDERRDLLRGAIMPEMPEQIRLSERFDALPADIVAAAREQRLEGIIAKHRRSLYESNRRSGAWAKMRINQGQELVVGGYVPAGRNFDSLIVGYYERSKLLYAARVRNGFVPALREKIFERLRKLERATCPFANLPQGDKGRWGQGLTADKMAQCRWLKPQLVAQIEYADWTDVNHLRHSRFVALRDDKAPKEVRRDPLTS